MEELIVTGSYIPRDNFDLASPVDIINADDIAEQGTVHMGDVLRNLTYNYGTSTLDNLTGLTQQVADQSFANLRGLGSRATLSLMDSRRIARANSNLLYPQIAIERIEVLKDGGSPLYGTDAVAGVMNFIPYHQFDGVKLDAYGLTDDNRDYHDYQLGAIGGHQWSNTSLVAAVEYRSRSRLRQRDKEKFVIAGFTQSSVANPGNFRVPTRIANDADGNGAITADEVAFGPSPEIPDPGCGNPANAGSTKPATAGYLRSGFIDMFGRCSMEFGEFLDYLSDLSEVRTALFLDHTLNDRVRLSGEFIYTYQDQDGRFSPSFPGIRIFDLDPIVGDHPGNPYRAFVDRNGNGLLDEMLGNPLVNETLFAKDDNTNGVPDRDLDGDGVADPGAELDPNARVLLADIPFDPAGGIPFNEDVVASNIRLVGKGPRGLPRRLRDDGSSPFGIRTHTYRFSGGVDFDIADSGWSGNVWYTFNRSDAEQDSPEDRFSAVVAGLTPRFDASGNVVGGLGPTGDAFWNPFSTSQLQCANRVCGDVLTPETAPEFNTTEVSSQVSILQDIKNRFTTQVVDVLFNGTLVDLPAGPLGVALGAQWLRNKEEQDVAPIFKECDAWASNDCTVDDRDDKVRTLSGFFEFGVPLLDHARFGTMELQVAARYTREDFGFDSFDPKLALRYQPRNFLSLRASWGTSFVTPSLTQLEGPRGFFGVIPGVQDETCNVSGTCTPTTTNAVFFGGNSNLASEEAAVLNVGFTLRFLDGDLTFGLDQIRVKFEDRISPASGQDVVNLDALRFEDFLDTQNCEAAADPTACRTSARDEWIDPVNKATGRFESRAIVRGLAPERALSSIEATWINGQNADFRGTDFRFNLRFDGNQIPWIGGDYGLFGIGLDASYVDEFNFKVTPLTPIEGAAGDRNDPTSLAPPMPRWRANGRFSWIYQRHAVAVLGHYIHRVEEDSVFGLFGLTPSHIASRTTWDVNYALTWDGLFGDGRTTQFSLGVINIFERLTDPIVALGNAETLLHDPRGRRYYARVTQSL